MVSLGAQGGQVLAEAVMAVGPHPPVTLDPAGGRVEAHRLQNAGP
jgi:hypothetical protein